MMKFKDILREWFDWSHATQKELVHAAEFWALGSNTEKESTAFASGFVWSYVPNFPIEKLGSIEEWKRFFEQEQEFAKEDGRNYDDMIDEDIQDPVIIEKQGHSPVVERQGCEYSLWDGNHRVGAVATKGGKFIPAIVGVPKQ